MGVVPLNGVNRGRGPSAEKGGLLAILDLGSSKISCIIAEAAGQRNRSGRSALLVLGVGHQAARGIKAGAIVDLDEAERAIRLTVDAAERMAQRTIANVYISVSGGRPQSQSYRGEISLAQGLVAPADPERAMAAGLAQVDLRGRALLHATPSSYELDGSCLASTPIGMHGKNLAAQLNVVTVAPAHLRNLTLAVERAHLDVAGYVLAPYAAGKAVLAEDEMELGTVLIEMGAACTSFALFQAGHLHYAETIPLGGQHVTADIAQGLNTTLAHAERLKVLMGGALASSGDDLEMVAVPLLGERGIDTVQQVPRAMLTSIIRARIDETFDLLARRIAVSHATQMPRARAVLTGGASQLPGISEVASHWLSRPVRLAAPLPIHGMPEAVSNAGFSVAHGLLAYAMKPDQRIAMPETGKLAANARPASYARRVGRWIAESF